MASREDLQLVPVSEETTVEEVGEQKFVRTWGTGTWLCCYSWAVNFAVVKQNIL